MTNFEKKIWSLGRSQSNSVVGHIVNRVELAKEDVAQNPGVGGIQRFFTVVADASDKKVAPRHSA